ncbi:MAG: hypothetical protein ACE367_25470 [Acidimicrobiales bacterium]
MTQMEREVHEMLPARARTGQWSPAAGTGSTASGRSIADWANAQPDQRDPRWPTNSSVGIDGDRQRRHLPRRAVRIAGDVERAGFRGKLGDQVLDAVVLTTGAHAYRRADGIGVVPLALLGP